mmetsp:Transcript_30756/g.89800  ORF Transcript_30756/g.89800 Transcript_30756/m.89800 type:complete len:274 (+) Transcript_30756:815-1636(+)
MGIKVGRRGGRRHLANTLELFIRQCRLGTGALPLPTPPGVHPVPLATDLIQLGGGALTPILGKELVIDIIDGSSRRGGLPRSLPSDSRGVGTICVRSRLGHLLLIGRPLNLPLDHPPQHAVPPILDAVVRPSPAHHPGNLGPLAPQVLVRLDDGIVLLPRPRPLINARIEVVVPSLPALLAQSTRTELFGQEAPTLHPVLLDQRNEAIVLGGRPRTLDQTRPEDLLPPVEALDVGPVGEGAGDGLPVLPGVQGDRAAEDGVLGCGPLGGGGGG